MNLSPSAGSKKKKEKIKDLHSQSIDQNLSQSQSTLNVIINELCIIMTLLRECYDLSIKVEAAIMVMEFISGTYRQHAVGQIVSAR